MAPNPIIKPGSFKCLPPFQLWSKRSLCAIALVCGAVALYSCQSDPDEVAQDVDTDGDGVTDQQELLNGTNKDDPCDPVRNQGYTAYDAENAKWATADCDADGTSNADELANGTDPYVNDILDTDGDGLADSQEVLDGTDKDNPCDPVQGVGYLGFDSNSAIWSAADCDGDLVSNGEEFINATDPYSDDTVYPVPEFLPKLSELRIFKGALTDLLFEGTVHEYALSTPLFTDYAFKLRSFALPKGTQIVYNGEGLLIFPDNSILTKTFYYLNDERDPGQGKKIIETRIFIKKNGSWTVGNYKWNDEQTEAFLDDNSSTVTVNWIDDTGNNRAVNYRIPSKNNCMLCHNNNGTPLPIGPKSRALNFTINGSNQLQNFIDDQLISGAPQISQIPSLPDWSDNSYTLEERARAYLDVNCAHCHQPGGSYNINNGDNFEFRYETAFDATKIYDMRGSIQDRISTQIPNYFMPYIGTTVIHTEGVDLINQYIDTL